MFGIIEINVFWFHNFQEKLSKKSTFTWIMRTGKITLTKRVVYLKVVWKQVTT